MADTILVPREPTEAMIRAYCETCERLGIRAWANASVIWPAMLAAAPTPQPLREIDPGRIEKPRGCTMTPDLPEKDGWQLIETAPKDGTRILGFDGFGLVVMEWWEPDADDKRDGCVATWVSFSGTGEEYIEPTHWMPLPSAPPPKAGT